MMIFDMIRRLQRIIKGYYDIVDRSFIVRVKNGFINVMFSENDKECIVKGVSVKREDLLEVYNKVVNVMREYGYRTIML